MYVIGHSNTLKNSYIWNTLIYHASENNAMVALNTANDDIQKQCSSSFARCREDVTAASTYSSNSPGTARSSLSCVTGGARDGPTTAHGIKNKRPAQNEEGDEAETDQPVKKSKPDR